MPSLCFALSQGYAARFLHMMFAFPTQPFQVDPVLSRALEKARPSWTLPLSALIYPCTILRAATVRHLHDVVHAFLTWSAYTQILILHMDHEQNASTSTVRTAGEAQSLFSCWSRWPLLPRVIFGAATASS